MSDDRLTQSTFRAVLDTLIPARNDALPGAGSLGVGEYVEERLGPLRPMVAAGLAALDDRAVESGASEFAEMTNDERASLLSDVASSHSGFLESLLFHTYSGYYQHPRVAVAIGMNGQPPHPVGYELEQGDLGLLDAVRGREKFYRDV
jgi:hypothetical protein